MLQTLKNAWRTKDIRAKILFTLFILLLYRIGSVVPVPFVDANSYDNQFQGTILQYLDVLSGGSLGQATLFALGVSPYINASIIIQLLAVVFPKLGEISKNDKEKMTFITRIVTIILALITAIGYYFLLSQWGMLTPAATKASNPKFWIYAIVIIACYCAGASLIMWLADRVNERGLGNGISVILFANIICTLPSQLIQLYSLIKDSFGYEKPVGYIIGSILFALTIIAIAIIFTVFVIFITGSERRIPVQYAKRVVGRKMYGGQNSNLPIKLNMTGVMPVIFASSIVSLVPTILALCGVTNETAGFWGKFSWIIGSEGPIYPIALFLLIIGFAYFYTQITFDPVDVANNLKKQGGAIPGIRQGRPTSDYIRKILNKITLAGALFLSVIAVVPVLATPLISFVVEKILLGQTQSWDASMIEAYAQTFKTTAKQIASTLSFGGTSLIIVVGVALETFRDLEAQLTMRSYKGFLD